MKETVVIVGAGHAAGQVVATFKQRKTDHELILIGDEAYLPYQRPPLSKKYLSGELDENRLLVKPAGFYAEQGLQVLLNTRVTQLSTTAKSLQTSDGQSFSYDKLILALGSRARQVPLPGVNLPGVHYLRTIDDVKRLRQDLSPGRQLVIIGAGYIGLEVAAVCRNLGLKVTVVELADRVMSRVVSTPVSAYFQRLHEHHGVDFMLSAAPQALLGTSSVSAVAFANGDTLPTDLVLIAAGILPNVELAGDAGLQIDNGIAVNDRCQSSAPDVYAIGDCSSHPNSIYGRRLRLESVHNALEQAKTAVNNICGMDDRYAQVPWFWSDQYDIKLQIAGLAEGYDHVVIRGDSSADRFACFYLREQRLIAVDAINSPKEFLRAKGVIAAREIVDPARLADPGQDITAARPRR